MKELQHEDVKSVTQLIIIQSDKTREEYEAAITINRPNIYNFQ